MSDKSLPVTFRCPSEVLDGIDNQAKSTSQNRTDVLVDLIVGSIPNVKVIERSKLPQQPAIYFVFTPNKELLYVGKTDNLQKRWNNHHKYQYFIETSLESRIGYFTLSSIEDVSNIIEELQNESLETPSDNVLVTNNQFKELEGKHYALKREFDITFSSLSQMGLESLLKRFESLKPPRGQQPWSPTSEERKEGIVKSTLAKYFGFNTIPELESAASFYDLDLDKYLEELSGWQCKTYEQGSTRTKFFPKPTTKTFS